MPRIVSPITGQEERRGLRGTYSTSDADNRRRWRGWWKVANGEQFFTFFLVGFGR